MEDEKNRRFERKGDKMNYGDFKDLTTNIGFPIAAAVALAWIVYKLGGLLLKSHAAHLEANTLEMREQTRVLQEIKDKLPSLCTARCPYEFTTEDYRRRPGNPPAT